MGEPRQPEPNKNWFLRKLPRKKGSDEKLRGSLDSLTRLEGTYANILKDKEVQEDLKDVFQTVRIAVFGRSGSGKTTIIRLVMGDDGPQAISEGTAGNQDINQEWHCPDPELPIIIHDSNGMDIKGQERVETIKKFLDEHQNNGDFSQRIHLVWYVISAADGRFLDDGDVMKLVSSYDIPLLLVMTFNDWKDAVAQNVTDRNLDQLLSGVRDKENVKKRMVRLANKVRIVDNKLIGERDLAALKLLSMRTKEQMGKKLRYTWAASQAVDMHEKLDTSAKLIVRYKKAGVYSSVVSAIPVAGQMKLTFMFVRILKSLGKIWRVPPNLEKALFRNVLMKDGSISLLRDMLKNMVVAAGLVVTVAATVVTGGVAVPSVVAWLAATGSVDIRGTPVLLMNFSLLILGSILYVKSIKVTRDKWDPDRSEEDYTHCCDQFAQSDHAQKLTNFARRNHSTWDTMLRTKKENGKIKNQLVTFFGELMLKRPGSLLSLMNSDSPEQDHEQHTDAGQDPAEDENFAAVQDSTDDDDDDDGGLNDVDTSETDGEALF